MSRLRSRKAYAVLVLALAVFLFAAAAIDARRGEGEGIKFHLCKKTCLQTCGAGDVEVTSRCVTRCVQSVEVCKPDQPSFMDCFHNAKVIECGQ